MHTDNSEVKTREWGGWGGQLGGKRNICNAYNNKDTLKKRKWGSILQVRKVKPKEEKKTSDFHII